MKTNKFYFNTCISKIDWCFFSYDFIFVVSTREKRNSVFFKFTWLKQKKVEKRKTTNIKFDSKMQMTFGKYNKKYRFLSQISIITRPSPPRTAPYRSATVLCQQTSGFGSSVLNGTAHCDGHMEIWAAFGTKWFFEIVNFKPNLWNRKIQKQNFTNSKTFFWKNLKKNFCDTQLVR